MDYTMSPAQMETAAGPARPTLVYAGFWKRFLAYIIDAILLYIGYAVIAMIFLGGASLGFSRANANDPAAAAAIAGTLMMTVLIFVALAWLYSAFMESSKNQGTLGKMALGLRVTDLDGNPITFGRATGRFFGKLLSGMILNIGFIMAGFTEKKQGLHDIIAGTLVLGKSSTVPANVAENAYRSESVAA